MKIILEKYVKDIIIKDELLSEHWQCIILLTAHFLSHNKGHVSHKKYIKSIEWIVF